MANFDVIVISETWLINVNFCTNLFHNYSFVFHEPTASHVGGLGIFIHNKFSFKVLDNLKIPTTLNNCVENIWVQLTIPDSDFIVILGGVYRHPSQHVNDFWNQIEPSLSHIADGNFNEWL